MDDKIVYVGQRKDGNAAVGFQDVFVEVTVDGITERSALNPLPSRQLWNHSAGFDWGYVGSGPAQLALAILLDAMRRCGVPTQRAKQLAIERHQLFKRLHVERFEHEGWRLKLADFITFVH